jgi:hypothetical protein
VVSRLKEVGRTFRQQAWAENVVEAQLATIAEFGSPQTGPNGENQAPGCSGSGSAQANLRFAHLLLRLKQQLLRSKDGNGNLSKRLKEARTSAPTDRKVA